MKTKIIFCLLFSLIYVLNANNVSNFMAENIECVTNVDGTELQFTIPDYQIEEIEAEGNNYQRIITTGAGEYALPGYPEVPCFSTLVAVPDQGRIGFEIISVQQAVEEQINLYPRQNLQSESQPPDRSFVINEDIYGSDSIYPEFAAMSGEPVIMRDYRLVRITFNPFQYDALGRNLIINQQITVRIFAEDQPGINEILKTKKPSEAFAKMLSNSVVNFESYRRNEEFQKPCILYIYYNNSTVEDYLQYLVDWRQQKGFDVHAVSTSATGNSANSIKNYIQDAYDEWENPPDYVCLVGDANGSFTIPCFWIDTGETDNDFVRLDGNDYLPDAAIGRIPFDTTAQLSGIISKIINYEKEPYMVNTNWYNRALMVGDPSTSGTTCIDTKLYVDDMMAITAPNIDPINVFSGNYSSQINSNINQGCVYFNYRGHGDFSGWSVNAINNLTNGNKLPVVVFLTCATGSYASYGDCMSERFLKVGSATNPSGAVAAISTATSLTHTTYNNCIDQGIWTGVFVDENWNMGMGLTRGKLNMYINFPNNPANCQHQFISWNNLMGDPAMEVWSDIPQQLSVVYPEQLNPGMSQIEVQIYSGGNPDEGSLVTLLDEEGNSISVYSDASGSAWLPLENLTAGDLMLTVSKHNYIPWQSELELADDIEYFSVDFQVIDDITGNGDGYANPGEEIELQLSLTNYFSENFSDLTLTAQSTTPGIEFTNNSLDISEIEANGTYLTDPNISLILPDNITGIDDLIIDFTLAGSGEIWSFRYSDTVFAPSLLLEDYELSITGNLDPGGETDIVVYLLNAGQQSASNVILELVSNDNRLIVSDISGYCGQIPGGSMGNNTADPFHIVAQTDIIPGTQIELTLQITTPELTHPAVSFLLTIGEAGIGDPLGPDGGGYYCYDQSDTGYIDCPEYDWIEIDPNYGGQGTGLNLYDNGNTGDTEVIDIPINFKFYDITYDEISICSNGWISPGETAIRDFMNWSIPGPGGPSPMIAPFWDDLITNPGNVFYYHDQTNHTFIVEWSHMRIDYSYSPVTFQAIIYDADHYPSSGGNSNLLFQYEEFNNDDQGSYGGYYVLHGQFATIGIEDHTSTSGLEYTYNNVFPLQADQLQDGSAIFFTSEPIPSDEAYLVLYDDIILDSGEDGQIDYGDTAEIMISLNNIGLQPAENVSAVASLSDDYVFLIQDSITYPDIPGSEYLYPETGFEIEVNSDCPDGHEIELEITVYYNGIYIEKTRSFTVYAPSLEPGFVFIINDNNSNQMIDPGESFDLGVVIYNTGGASVYSPDFYIFSVDPALTIGSASNQLSEIPGSGESYLIFPASVDDTIEIGDQLGFLLNVEGDLGYVTGLEYMVSVGVVVEGFESGDFSRFPWETGGSEDFLISNITHSGNFSAVSGNIDDGQTTWLDIDITTAQAGQAAFWIYVSTESYWDVVSFYIDDILQDDWSGQTGWMYQEFDIDEGDHTLLWEYEKDNWGDGGSDCFWLDDVEFPTVIGNIPEIILTDVAEFSFELADDETGSAQLGLWNISSFLGQFEIRIEPFETFWLSVIPDEGFITPNETEYIEINCDPQGLVSGDYRASIYVSDNFGNESTLPVYLSYTSTPNSDTDIPLVTSFNGNYPNPFNPETTFTFQIAQTQFVNLDIYNIKGQKVRSLASEEFAPGYYTITWNGRDDNNRILASGIYFSSFRCPQTSKNTKLLLLK